MSKCLGALLLTLLLSAPVLAQTQPSPGLTGLTVREALQNEMTVRELFSILNEREKAANQRFDGQEKAINSALQALEKTTANALAALDKNNAAALTAAKEAVTKAEVAAEKRFDSVNEFRNTLKDQQATLASKQDVDTRFRYLEEKVTQLQAVQNKSSGSLEAAGWIWVAGIMSCGLIFAGLTFYRKQHPRGRRA